MTMLNKPNTNERSDVRQKPHSTTYRKQKTISRHVKNIVHSFHIDPKKWTRLTVAKFAIKAAFWIPIYSLGIYLTISSSVILIQQYQESPIYLSMTAMINQPTVSYPNQTVCFHINLTKFFDGVDETNKNGSSESYTDILENFFKESTQNGIFNPTQWPNTSNGVLIRYLTMMYELEWSPDPTENSSDWLQYEQSNDEHWLALNNVLVPKIAKYNITIAQLKAAFQNTFFGMSPSSSIYRCMFLFELNTILETCKPPTNLISFIGHDSICFRIINEEYLIINDNTTQVSTFDVVLYDVQENGEGGKVQWPVSLDFTGRSSPPPLKLPTSEINYILEFPAEQGFYSFYHISVNITTLYRALPGVNKTCSLKSTLEECEHLCRSKLIEEKCGCAPITFLKTDTSSSFANCTFDQYKICLKNLGNDDQCRNNCVPNCEKWIYEFDMEIYSKSFQPDYSRREYQMKMNTNDYLIMQETYTWTFVQFVGALGGAMGIWLGLDFGILIGFIFSPIMLLIRKLLSKKGVTEEQLDNESETDDQSYWRKFVRLSHQYGKSRPLIATWYFEKLFWTVIYTAGGVSTGIYCWNLIQQYTLHATHYNVNILFNKSINLPDARLCFENRYVGPFYYYSNSSYVGVKLVLTQDLENYFNQTTAVRSRESFFDQTNAWPESLKFAAFLYVGMMTSYEMDPAHDIPIYGDSLFQYQIYNGSGQSWSPFLSRMEKEDIENALTNILLPKLLAWHISFDDLLQTIGQLILQNFNFSITFYNSTTTVRSIVLKTPRTELITNFYGMICYQLPMSEITFLQDGDLIEIYAETPTYFFGRAIIDFTIQSIAKDYQIQLTGSDDKDKYGTLFNPSYGQTTNYSLGINSFYSSMPVVKGSEKCENEPTDPWPCWYAIIKNKCNCTPISNVFISPPPTFGLPECTMITYNICGTVGSSSSPQECKSTYPPACKTWYFSSTSSIAENDLKQTENGTFLMTVIRFSVKDFSYAEIQEQVAFTFQEFLAAFGGMLGIWLSLSFFSVVRFVAFPIELILDLLSRKVKERFSKSIDPNGNIKLNTMIRSRLFLTVEYLFDFKYEKIYKKINLPTILTHAIMAIFFFFGLFETGAMCFALFHSYVIGETSSTVQFMNNKTFTLPLSTICFPIGIATFNVTDTGQKFLHQQRMKETFSFKDKKSLLSDDWPNVLMQISLEHVAIYGKIERTTIFQNFTQATLLENDQRAISGLFVNNWTTVGSFDNYIRSLNISIEEQKQKCGKEFQKRIVMDMHFNSTVNGSLEFDNGPLDIIGETTYIGDATICYQLHLDKLVFSSKKDRLSLNISRELFPTSQNLSLTVNLNGRDSNLNLGETFTDGSVLTTTFGQMMNFKIKIEALFIGSSYKNGAMQCSQDIKLEDCQDNCRIRNIQKYCNCTPVSWSRFTSIAAKFCTLDDYMNCFQLSSNSGLNYFHSESDSSNCSSKCLPYCKRIKYVEQTNPDKVEANHAQFSITILQFPYFVYSENLAHTFTTFISEFGGYIGVWVCLDFLIFSQSFFFALCFMLRLFMILIKKPVLPDHEETPVKLLEQNFTRNIVNTSSRT